jgi:hypothetical protein
MPQSIPLSNGIGMTSGDTTSANNSNTLPSGGGTPPSPSCTTSGWQDGKDLVYSYTLGATANVTVTATPLGVSSLNPIVYVRKPNACTSILLADELACDNPVMVTAAKVTLTNQTAGTYFLWVDSAVQTSGAFNLTVATCNATNCPTGCCNGTVCLTSPTSAACGAGGASCVNCGFQTCDVPSGTCVGDAGTPSSCSPACTSGQCCDGFMGFGNACVSLGAACPITSIFITGATCKSNGNCE